MARSSRDTITTRIALQGGDEVKRHFQEIGRAGEASGNQIRATLLAATSGLGGFSSGAKASVASSGQMRFALQNLTFQVNDVATSLASGGDVMRVFAQQGGQIFQVFQQGGGPRAVLGAAASAIGSMITPMTLAAAAAIALGAAMAALISRASSAQSAAREFDVVLKGMGKTGQVTGDDLAKASRGLRDVGLSAAEAQKAMLQAIRAGVDPAEADRIVRIGQDLNAVLGDGSMEQFIAAAGKGGEPLRQFAERLGIVSKSAADSTAAVRGAAGEISASSKAIADALGSRNRAIAEQQRQAKTQIADLTRERGTAEEEIERASKERILEINRESVLAVNALIAQRNEENAKKLAEYNKQIEEAAQKAAENSVGLIGQIEAKVKGARDAALGPFTKAVQELGLAWSEMLTELAQSEVIQSLIANMTSLLKVVTDLIREMRKLPDIPIPGIMGGSGTVSTVRAATGGLVRGPGSGTSDSIVARISNGEFVVNAFATQRFLPLLQNINSLRGFAMGGLVDGLSAPLVPRSRGFRAGGLAAAAAGGGGTPVHLHLDGKSFALRGEEDVAERLIKHARGRRLRSGGRAPSWVG